MTEIVMGVAMVFAAVVPPSLAYAFAHYIHLQRTKHEAAATLERQRVAYDSDKAKCLHEEQTKALLENYKQIELLQTRVTQLEDLAREQQLSINRMAERF